MTDLKIADIAELFHVTEDRVRNWIETNQIPYYQLGHQFRFDRLEIENWVFQQQAKGNSLNIHEESFSKYTSPTGQMRFDLYRAIYHGQVHKNVAEDNKWEIIKTITERISNIHDLDSESLISLLIDRENLLSTGVGKGIALPHTRDFIFPKHFDIVSVVYPEQPIEYGSIDNEPVHTLFFLFASTDKQHLHLLNKISLFCNSDNNIAFLKTKPDTKEILKKVRQWEGQL